MGGDERKVGTDLIQQRYAVLLGVFLAAYSGG